MKNYYTPDLSEFYVGFEFEIHRGYHDFLHKKTSIIEMSGRFISQEIKEGAKLKLGDLVYYRVKFLDQEDIQSFGFIHNHDIVGLNFIEKVFHDEKGKFEIRFNEELDSSLKRGEPGDYGYMEDFTEVTISYGNGLRVITGESKNLKERVPVFHGSIRNKSELGKILKMVGWER